MTRPQPIAGRAGAEPFPFVVLAHMRRYRAQSIMTCVGSADFHAHLGRRKFDFVMEDHEVGQIGRRVVEGFLHRSSRLVHEGFRAKQDDLLVIDGAFRRLALKAAAPWCKTMTPRDLIDGHEADVVAVMRVFRAGIAETNKEAHGAASRLLLLLLVATAGRSLGA